MIEKEPLAIGSTAFANVVAVVRGKKIRGGLCDRPQNAVKVASVKLPFPTIAFFRLREVAMLQRFQRSVVDLLQVVGSGTFVVGDGRKSAVKAFAEEDGFTKGVCGFKRVAARLGPQGGDQLWRQQIRLFCECQEIGIVSQMFSPKLWKMAPANGVGKIKAKSSATQVKLIFGVSTDPFHSIYYNLSGEDCRLGRENTGFRHSAAQWKFPASHLTSTYFEFARLTTLRSGSNL